MKHVVVTDEDTSLGHLIDRVEAGETIQIVRRGKPVARMVPDQAVRLPIPPDFWDDIDRIATPQEESAGVFMRRLRDDARF
ncbi:MAG TPA: type II toxin-antitoxin system prevent-host-death family antitoxin [Sphingomonas sp.]|jgi:antitoxin (DNA-binding transcriptional repressor) of toxin-antitoxin stability system|uniref:type II toxin-antitoxin system Phd/YefM family antitoxin n=1 Tax=Sphingomonas sp. TaxID=28214 RepID=UPI002ED7AAB4